MCDLSHNQGAGVHVNVYFLSAMAGVVALVWEALRTLQRRGTHTVEDIVAHAVIAFKDELFIPLDKRLVVLETKMDMVIGGVALNAVQVLHHPEPTRARVDHLLDVFKANTITRTELEELRDHLEVIRDWEPGEPAPYMIYQGEQAAAAMVLSTMDHVVDPEDDSGLLYSAARSPE